MMISIKNGRNGAVIAAIGLALALVLAARTAGAADDPGHASLVAVFEDFRDWRDAAWGEGLGQYDAGRVRRNIAELESLQAELTSNASVMDSLWFAPTEVQEAPPAPRAPIDTAVCTYVFVFAFVDVL